jgi:hypothetical protein
MKRFLLYSTVFMTVLSACSKKLDVDPLSAVDEEQVYTSDANIKKALNGAYDAVSSSAALGGDIQLYSELMASETVNGELRWGGTFNQPGEVFAKQVLTNNSYITATWAACYRAINICNGILANIDLVDDADQDRVKGEAQFLRGTMYFELVKLYSKPFAAGGSNLGLQLITEPTVKNTTEANFSPRSTVVDTYAQIVSDLSDAKALLPEENGFYATTQAASAQLSRVYLQMEDYVKARDEANTAISVATLNAGMSLNPDYADAFNNQENSSEDLFAIQVNSQDGANDMHLFWSIQAYGARDGDVDVLQKHMNLYAAGAADDRYAFFYRDGNVWRSGKWRLQYRNLPIIRLAEMYLTRAEANQRLGTSVGATPFQDISLIRSRVGLSTTLAYITLNNILLERKLELAHEGQAIHDLKRTRGTTAAGATAIPWDANRLVLPIPIRDVNASNGALEQNPGY